MNPSLRLDIITLVKSTFLLIFAFQWLEEADSDDDDDDDGDE